MAQLVLEVRRSNQLAKYNNGWLKTVTYLFALAVFMLLAVGLLAWEIFGNVTIVEANMAKSVTEVQQLVTDVSKLSGQQQSTDKKLDAVKKDRDEQPKIELVAESDPEKAKDNPLKVRITSPKSPSKKGSHPSASPTAVEVPLPTKGMESVDLFAEKKK